MKNLYKGFTLAELLMAVLVISIIMVALAPVITRRAYDNVSIEVNKKKGLEIFTNPGIYTFDVPVGINTLFLQGSAGGGGGGGATYIDKSVSFTSNTTWTVPRGISQLTFTITGSGGGGGAANGKAAPSVNEKNNRVYNNKCLGDEFLAIRGSDDETDLCYTKRNLSYPDAVGAPVLELSPNLAQGETCTRTGTCCWDGNALDCSAPTSGTSATGCNRSVCTLNAANQVCSAYKSTTRDEKGAYRIPQSSELNKVVKYLDAWSINAGSSGLQICSHNDYAMCNGVKEPPTVPLCNINSGCNGAFQNYCVESYIWASSGQQFGKHGSCSKYVGEGYGVDSAASVRCVRSLNRYTRYSGAGGSSGARLQKTINVLPGDTLAITIGAGGAGGVYNSSKNNGLGSRTGNGAQGSNTQIVHKRGSVTMGTYDVKGGFGGWGATTSAHGKYSSSDVTPSGTCYAQSRANTSASLSGGNVSCSINSVYGNEGTTNGGGAGARVNYEGTVTPGGTLYIDSTRTANQRNTQNEADKAKGQNATVLGYGGGGGLTPGWATGSSHFYNGGKGANGKVDISYRVMLPGSGGGSGTRVGGSKMASGADTLYEIKYKVTEGSRLVFEIGAGGTGGAQGQDGTSGTPTVIGDDKIIFLAGEGGKTLNQTQKNNLSNCIGTNTNSTTIANCINNSSYKASGGKASYISVNQALGTNALGLIINESSKVSYTISSNFKGYDGKSGAQNLTTVPYTYGFDGGVGGSPFGIKTNSIRPSITCGGGISGNYGTETNASSYICTSGSIDGNNARTHDPVNNEFGGSGGGGGGVTDTSFNLGSGGGGSSGYLRIRWDETEQD